VSTSKEAVVEDIVNLLNEIVSGRDSFLDEDDNSIDVNQDVAVADLGVDSIDLSYVFSFAERTYDITFDNADLSASQYGTIGTLIDTVWSRIESRHA
jgi:acyl carrier protein